MSVTDVWVTLAPGLALHDKIPLFWGQYDTMSKKMSDNKSLCVLSCWAILIFLKTVSYNITKFPLSRVKQTTEGVRSLLSTKGFVLRKWYFFSLISSSKILRTFESPHSSTLVWKISWAEEPGRLQSMESRRVRHDWVTSFSLFTFLHWRRKCQPTPVFLPGEPQGRGSLVGCRLWGHTELDTTEVT